MYKIADQCNAGRELDIIYVTGATYAIQGLASVIVNETKQIK